MKERSGEGKDLAHKTVISSKIKNHSPPTRENISLRSGLAPTCVEDRELQSPGRSLAPPSGTTSFKGELLKS